MAWAAVTSCCAAAGLRPCKRDPAIVLLGAGPWSGQRADCASSARSAVDVHVTAEGVDHYAAVATADPGAEMLAGAVLAAVGLAEIAAQVAAESVGLDLCRGVFRKGQAHIAAHAVYLPARRGRERRIQLQRARDGAEIHPVQRIPAQQQIA